MASSSAKWRALQRRHKWSYDALRFPASLLLTIKSQREHPLLTKFVKSLLEMAQLLSTHAQVTSLKKVVASFQELLSNRSSSREFVLEAAIRMLVEVLFLENSLALHRMILCCLASLPEDCKKIVNAAFGSCCSEYGVGGAKARRFALVAFTSSLINLPKPGILDGALGMLAAVVTESLSHDMMLLLQYACDGGRPSPSAMEECQDAIACLYYMFQYYPSRLWVPCTLHPLRMKSTNAVCSNSSVNNRPALQNHASSLTDDTITLFQSDIDGHDAKLSVFHAAVDVILNVLQTSYLSRDCSVGAGVGLCAAFQFQKVDWKLALTISNSLFSESEKCLMVLSEVGLQSGCLCETTIEGVVFLLRGTSLADEVAKFTEFGRLCTYRGLLTAMPRSILNFHLLYVVNNDQENKRGMSENTFSIWTPLFDGILPSICHMLESSIDAHFKFHSVTALQVCLQQIKASFTTGTTIAAQEELQYKALSHGLHVHSYSPITDTAVQRMLNIVWNNWEDPLNQTVKQVQVIFNLLVDMKYLLIDSKISNCEAKADKTEELSYKQMTKEFLMAIAKELLSAGGHRKGRYVPLASISLRIGALNMLKMSPTLLFDTINAMADDDVCSSASSFLKVFLERLREECYSSEGGIMEGSTSFRHLSLPPLIGGMVSGNSRLRINLNIYALPVALQIDSDAVLPMLAYALDDRDGGFKEVDRWHEDSNTVKLPKKLARNQQVALLVGLLKVSRTLGLMEGDLCSTEVTGSSVDQKCGKHKMDDTALVSVKRNIFHIPLLLFELAITHNEESLRIDAAEALCLNPKTASLPSYLELALLQVSIPLNMRCCSSSFRMKWTSLFRKFFSRIRLAVDRQQKAIKKQENMGICENMVIDEGPYFTMPVSVEQIYRFMEWLSQLLVLSIYPSAPYERKSMAMELIVAILEIWSFERQHFDRSRSTYGTISHIFLRKDATIAMIRALVDSWDRLREGAYRILLCYPNPLPGLDTASDVEKVLTWAVNLVKSPRVRESDAGALVMRLLFQKYVVQLGWGITLHPKLEVKCTSSCEDGKSLEVGIAISNFLETLNDWLESGVIEGEKDLLRACSHSFVHGILLSLRYVMDELDWFSSSLIAIAGQLKSSLSRLLSLLTRVTGVALWVVSSGALNMSDASKLEDSSNTCFLFEDEDTNDIEDWSDMVGVLGDEDGDVGFWAPTEQAVIVGCWLAMKEVSLLLGTVTRKVPLPGGSVHEGRDDQDVSSVSMLDLSQLEMIGSHFLQVLLAMKHNGAIDKTRAGFAALCNRLLCSNNTRLSKMPEIWLQQLMDRTTAKGQTVDDLVRRSAGVPAAFLTFFLAEPEGAPKKLLFIALRWVIDLAGSFVTGDFSRMDRERLYSPVKTQNGDVVGDVSMLLKARDEGVVPTVHAFNVMRVTFNDTNLATDSSGFCAEGLMVAIQAFSCNHWEVRNAATLAFVALLRRMVGYLNVHTQLSARRAITSFEFFHRYPALHPFLLQELRNATSQFAGDCIKADTQNLNGTLHPSLAPVLTILSRLKPSVINNNIEDWLSPSAFIPYVCSCATQSNFRVRVLASQALSSLVVPESLPMFLINLLRCLPMQGHINLACQTLMDEDCINPFKVPFARLTFNTFHGVLLQMQSLLLINCASLPLHSGIRTDILYPLMQVIHSIDRGKLLECPMVAATLLEVINGLSVFEGTFILGGSAHVSRDILTQMSASFLDDAVMNAFNKKEQQDSTLMILKHKACKLYYTSMLLHWPPSGFCLAENGDIEITDLVFLVRLKACLFDSMCEVRLGLLKVLKMFLDLLYSKCGTQESAPLAQALLQWVARCLQPLLIESLNLETHPRCMRYLLLNFFSLNMLQVKIGYDVGKSNFFGCGSSNMERSSVVSLWRLFLNLYENSKHAKTQETVICCLGLCIQKITHHVGKAARIQDDCCVHRVDETSLDMVNVWIGVIKQHSLPSEPVMMRKATAKSAVASGVLELVDVVASHYRYCKHSSNDFMELLPKAKEGKQPIGNKFIHKFDEQEQSMDGGCIFTSLFARTILDVWFVCIKLLEDEDMELREYLATLVLHVMSNNAAVVDIVPMQVEKVIHLSFEFLSSKLCDLMLYLDFLASWVLREVDDVSFMQGECDLVRRLFDKEIDNHHEERLLSIQLCCFHLNDILKRGNKSTVVNARASLYQLIMSWRTQFLLKLKSCVEKCLCFEANLQWLGGLTNHPDVFRAFYPLLLGLLALSEPVSTSVEPLGEFIAELDALLQEMLPLASNSLIFNLLLMVLKQYDSQNVMQTDSCVFLSSKEDLFLDNFDPYFILG